MSTLNIDSTTLNKTTHRAVLKEIEIKKILWKAVAEQLGIDLSAAGVNFSCQFHTGSSMEALIMVTVDHDKQPTGSSS